MAHLCFCSAPHHPVVKQVHPALVRIELLLCLLQPLLDGRHILLLCIVLFRRAGNDGCFVIHLASPP